MRHIFISVFSVIFIFTFALNLTAQPQYFNSNVGTSYNSFPLNVAAGKMVQTLIAANEFNQPSPAPAGNITKYYLMISPGYPLGPATYTSFRILFSQTSLTALPSGSFYPGPWDTVFVRTSVTLQAAAESWLQFTLDNPYAFNPTQGLVVQIEQCGASGTLTGYSVRQTSTPGVGRRSYSSGPCPYVYGGLTTSVINCGIDISTTPTYALPDLIYYKFKNNPDATSTPNYAVPGVGSNPAQLTGTSLSWTSGGQFDSCILGTGVAGGHINTNWATNFGSGSWTISMWLNELPNNTSLYYLFEEATGAFRCFLGGAAGAGGLRLTGTGITNVNLPGVAPGPTVVHFVYDSVAATISAYKNGVFALSVVQTPLNLATGTNFQVGGYSTLASLNGKMDEFRVYRRALDSNEIAATWNIELGGIPTGIKPLTGTIPDNYLLLQNYPNPFNPVTKISFAIPESGFVTLKVYDVLGREISSLVNAQKNAGSYVVDFDASNLTSGIYFYRLDVNGFVDTKKMTVLK